MIVDDIIDQIETTISGLSVTPDAGAPAQFKAVDFGELEQDPSDRAFTVLLSSSDPDGQRDVTTASGPSQADYFVRVDVEVRYFNEGRSPRQMSSIVAQDRRRIIDVVQPAVRTGVTRACECVYEGGSIDRDVANSGVTISTFTFRTEYFDDVITS